MILEGELMAKTNPDTYIFFQLMSNTCGHW